MTHLRAVPDVQEFPVLFAGDIVEVAAPKYAGVAWKIIKVNPKNYRLVNEQGQTLKCPVELLRKSELPFTPAAPNEKLELGVVVELTDDARVAEKYKGHKYVVIKAGSAVGTWNITKLGGDGGSYFRSIPEASLKVIELDL